MVGNFFKNMFRYLAKRHAEVMMMMMNVSASVSMDPHFPIHGPHPTSITHAVLHHTFLHVLSASPSATDNHEEEAEQSRHPWYIIVLAYLILLAMNMKLLESPG